MESDKLPLVSSIESQIEADPELGGLVTKVGSTACGYFCKVEGDGVREDIERKAGALAQKLKKEI